MPMRDVALQADKITKEARRNIVAQSYKFKLEMMRALSVGGDATSIEALVRSYLTDFGGHQNAQFEDAITTIRTTGVKATIIAILDGVLYIKGNNKMYKSITTIYQDYNIMSALVLREFLYSI